MNDDEWTQMPTNAQLTGAPSPFSTIADPEPDIPLVDSSVTTEPAQTRRREMSYGTDPLYGSEVDADAGGLFPTIEITRPYLDSPTTNIAPVTDNSDIASRADEDEVPLDLVNEYGRTPPLNDLSQINDRHIVLPPAPE